jgi:hypothetical protein
MRIHFLQMFDKFQDLKEKLEIQGLPDHLDPQVILGLLDLMHRMVQLELLEIQVMTEEEVLQAVQVQLD